VDFPNNDREESASIYNSVTAYGYEMTLQVVPHHRVMGNYWFERDPGSGRGAYLGDGALHLPLVRRTWCRIHHGAIPAPGVWTTKRTKGTTHSLRSVQEAAKGGALFSRFSRYFAAVVVQTTADERARANAHACVKRPTRRMRPVSSQ